MTSTETDRLERLVNYLQVAAPLVGRLRVTAHQSEVDARAAEIALENAVGLLKTWQSDAQEGK